MEKVLLNRQGTESVEYTEPTCAKASLKTLRIRYATSLPLPPNKYNDAKGYYIVWERCCRNFAITNIVNPDQSGSAFYLEFPAVQQNGNDFNNSSPQFSKPTGDYICLNEPFVFDFSATDPDGDELRYSLVTPLIGNSSFGNPLPRSTDNPTYPAAVWSPGIDLQHVIPGAAPLKVNSSSGQLSVTANQTGLYVFSVLCEEYRNNLRIGSVRRDFQLMVLDCKKNQAPQIWLRQPGKVAFYTPGDTLVIEDTLQRCLDVLVIDPDSSTTVSLMLQPLNFTSSAILFTPTTGSLNGPADTLRGQLCWNGCLESKDGQPLLMNLLVRDQGCPVGKTDTLLLTLLLKDKPNHVPTIQIDPLLPNFTAEIHFGDSLTFQVIGNDVDGDSIALAAIGRGFDLPLEGMSFLHAVAKGHLSVPFTWKPPCDGIGKEKSYTVDFIVTEKHCEEDVKDTVTVYLKVLSENNQPPQIKTSLENNTAFRVVHFTDDVPESMISFQVLASDDDQDTITVSGSGRGFSLEEAGMHFEEHRGVGSLTLPFTWQLTCKALQNRDSITYLIDFIVQENSCHPDNTDTTTVALLLKAQTSASDFLPPNVFTPNNDLLNDFFEIKNLPPNTCQEQFEGVFIYNRWGVSVFQTAARDFRWDGEGFSTGVYFYLLQYTNRRYKGMISLLR